MAERCKTPSIDSEPRQPSQRVKAIAIACPLLEQLLRGGWSGDELTVTGSVPEDARLIGAYTEPGHRTSYLVFEHPSFDEVPIGEKIPSVFPTFHRQESLRMRAFRVLNEALMADPEAIHQLVDRRVLCCRKLAEHPTIQVTEDLGDGSHAVGFLGLLNGIFVRDPETADGAIAGQFDRETGKLVGFQAYQVKDAEPAEEALGNK